jgi:hypothetical protein
MKKDRPTTTKTPQSLKRVIWVQRCFTKHPGTFNTMMYLTLFLLAIVLAFASTQAVDVTVLVEIDPSPSTGLAVCSVDFLTAFLNQLSGWVQQQTSYTTPDLVIGEFAVSYHDPDSRRLNKKETVEIQSHGVERKTQSVSYTCSSCTTGGCIVACAPAACTVCGSVAMPNAIANPDLYSYLSQTVQSLARNYVVNPSVPDNGCLGNIPDLNITVGLVPGQSFDPSAYPDVAATVASW